MPHRARVAHDVLLEIADAVGTPTYVYDAHAIDVGVERWTRAVGDPARIWYAVKANSNLSVLRRLASHGLGFEVVSGGEWARVRAAGVPPDRIAYGGVPKRDDELSAALEAGFDLVVLQAQHEVDLAADATEAAAVAKRVGLRVRPGIRAGAHPALETGVAGAKFGLGPEEVPAAWERLVSAPALEPRVLAVHLGSGIDSAEPYLRALELLLDLAALLSDSGTPVRELDLGGGFAIDYRGDLDPEPADLIGAVADRLTDPDLKVRFEPGRSILGRAGLLLTRVLYRRERVGSPALVCDAAFSDFPRPVLYGAEHDIEPLDGGPEGAPTVDVLGATCESGDLLGAGRALHGVGRGDLLLVRDVGAYGFTMASNYNGRPRPAEVLVEGDGYRVIRSREVAEDLWRGEIGALPSPPGRSGTGR